MFTVYVCNFNIDQKQAMQSICKLCLQLLCLHNIMFT